jgi:CRISPR-associated endonuclease/helicase Cas3
MVSKPIQVELVSRSISACQEIPPELEFMKPAPLQHQTDVFAATREYDIVLDLAPTGTGKTEAGLTALLHQPNSNAVYIAPTNALIEQQTKKAEEFIRSSNGKLNHIVKAVSAKEVRSWSNDRVGARPGEKLYNLLRNPATIFPEVGANRPILLVMNPDIFYYGTFFCYGKLDRVNLATSFYTQFSTIIFDEFHLYDAKQLVSLLFYLSYLHIFGFFQAGRRVILLTATPEPACESALTVLASQGVRINHINGEAGEDRIPSQTAVKLELRVQPERDPFLAEIAEQVARHLIESPDDYGAVILDSKDHINRLADLLEQKGLKHKFGRIHGSTPKQDRAEATQKQVILATSTVDVGFNFERIVKPQRQNLDWLICSARDRSAFWQRIGRVGRVLGKAQTDISSRAIAYFRENVWDEGLSTLDPDGGADALRQKLAELKSLNRPFLQAYWQSEALLETARPLLTIEGMMDKRTQSEYIPKLFETIKTALGGRRDWKYYQGRMLALEAARSIVNNSKKNPKEDPLKWIKAGKWQIVEAFFRSESPDDWDALITKHKSLIEFEKLFREYPEVAESLRKFATVFNASYAPLFQFRSSLFENVHIRDPKGLLLDRSDETELDPIHLLRNYEFVSNNSIIELTERAKAVYEIKFNLNYDGDLEKFKRTKLNKLSAFENCRIERRMNGSIAPTPLLSALEKQWLPGVIVSTTANQGAIIRLQKQGIISYPICVNCSDVKKDTYTIFIGFSGIITAAMEKNFKIRLMDEEEFWIVG